MTDHAEVPYIETPEYVVQQALNEWGSDGRPLPEAEFILAALRAAGMSPGPGPLRVGDVLIDFCGGHFGRDSYEDKRVEAIGADWVVARDEHGSPVAATNIDPAVLLEYRRG